MSAHGWRPMTPDEVAAEDAKLAARRAEEARLVRIWNCPHVVQCHPDCPKGTS